MDTLKRLNKKERNKKYCQAGSNVAKQDKEGYLNNYLCIELSADIFMFPELELFRPTEKDEKEIITWNQREKGWWGRNDKTNGQRMLALAFMIVMTD